MKQSITITRRDNGYILSVDGGSIECGTTAEVMSRVGHELGMPYGKAQRQLFERMEAAEKVTRDLEAENDALFRAKSEDVMSRVGHELGMPYGKAQRQLFERMETAEKVADSIGREATELRKELNDEREKNLQMRQAIVRWFIRAFKEG